MTTQTEGRFGAEQISYAIRVRRAIRAVDDLRQRAFAREKDFSLALQKTSPMARESAYNLVHYLALRGNDIRELQHYLHSLGISSLGHAEAHVMASLNNVLIALHRLIGSEIPAALHKTPPVTIDIGRDLLAEHTVETLGTKPPQRVSRIMVTMPSEAADDPSVIRKLLSEGMDVMRINCAHDDSAAWLRMIHHLRSAEDEVGRRCKVSFDLAGPKLRTEALVPGPEVVKWKPVRDSLGKVLSPARILFTSDPNRCDAPGASVLPIRSPLTARKGDSIRLIDARDRHRMMEVIEVTDQGWICESNQTGYVTSEMRFNVFRDGAAIESGMIATLPATESALQLGPGDQLQIVREKRLGRPAIVDEDGQIVEPATLSCTLPQVFESVRPGERILFDDGKISGVIEEVDESRLMVRVVSAAKGSAKLKGEKGINLPDSVLSMPALTEKDLEDLKFVVRHADLVALSFVQRPQDIDQLIRELERLEAPNVGVILKIETRLAFENLFQLLITALQRPPVAVMIARGDLGVEVGFERMPEIQEQILMFCQAAHVPAIWATQVLESLAKGGLPSRGEVTDAAMSSQAECVMLNKGPYIEQTMHFLSDILTRMQENHTKNMATLRKLRIADVRQS